MPWDVGYTGWTMNSVCTCKCRFGQVYIASFSYQSNKFETDTHNMVCVCYIIQMCSGITCGRVLNRELYAQRLQNLVYLH